MANDEIGALNVRVGLDGTGFQEGISSINRQLAVAKSEFKLASAQIADSGTAMDKARLQTDSLSQQIGIQSQKVDALSLAHQKSVESKGADVKATQDLEIKLNNAKTALAGMENELRTSTAALELSATGFGTVTKSAEKATLEARNFGTSMKETKEGIELTRVAMIGMGAIMAGGMLAEWADGSEKMAISLQKLQIETGSSQQEVERLAVVASGAGVSTDQLATMIGKLDLRVGNATLGTKSFASGLNDLGISAQKFGEANLPEQAAMIADAVKNSTLPTKQLDTALKNIGISAQNLGAAAKGNIDAISGSLALTSQEGTTLGRALNQAGIDMNTFAGADIETKLQMLGKYFADTQDKAKATALVMQVFGKSGQDMLPLIQNFAELDDYAKSLKMPVMDTKEIQLAAEKTKMLQTAMQMMMDSALVKLLPIVDSLGKAFYDLAANITHPVQAIGDFAKELGPIPTIITGVVTAFAAMKIVNAVVGTVGAFSESMKAASIAMGIFKIAEEGAEASGMKFVAFQNLQMLATKVATGVQIAFNAVMDANPIALVIIAIAALGVGIYELVTHWTVVREALSTGWSWLSNEAITVWGGITAFFQKWGVDLLAVFFPVIGLPILVAQHWQQIIGFAQQIWGDVVNLIQGIWTGFISWITTAAQSVADAVLNAFKWMYDHNTYVKLLVDKVVELWKGFVNLITPLWNGIVTTAQTIWDAFAGWFTTFWGGVTQDWNTVWDTISTALQTVWNDLVAVAITIWTPIETFFSGIWDSVSGTASSAWGAISTTMSGLWNGIVGDAENIFNGLGTFFIGLWQQAEQWGFNIVHMIAQGIQNAAHEVEQAASNVANSIKSFLGFHSPAEEGPGADADTWMPNLMNMLVEGVNKGAPKLQDALKRAIPGMESNLTANMSSGSFVAPSFAAPTGASFTQELAKQIVAIGGGAAAKGGATYQSTINNYDKPLSGQDMITAFRRMELLYGG